MKLSYVKISDKILLLFVDINDFGHTKSETKKDIFFCFNGVSLHFFQLLLLDFTMLLWIKTFILHCFIYFQSIDSNFFLLKGNKFGKERELLVRRLNSNHVVPPIGQESLQCKNSIHKDLLPLGGVLFLSQCVNFYRFSHEKQKFGKYLPENVLKIKHLEKWQYSK